MTDTPQRQTEKLTSDEAGLADVRKAVEAHGRRCVTIVADLAETADCRRAQGHPARRQPDRGLWIEHRRHGRW